VVAEPDDRPPTPPAATLRPTEDELARFLKPQPPTPIPPRTHAAPPPGLLARSLLGDRVIKR
jgi:hypothetical protein